MRRNRGAAMEALEGISIETLCRLTLHLGNAIEWENNGNRKDGAKEAANAQWLIDKQINNN